MTLFPSLLAGSSVAKFAADLVAVEAPYCGAETSDPNGDYICEKEPGHSFAHRDGGVSWTEDDL